MAFKPSIESVHNSFFCTFLPNLSMYYICFFGMVYRINPYLQYLERSDYNNFFFMEAHSNPPHPSSSSERLVHTGFSIIHEVTSFIYVKGIQSWGSEEIMNSQESLLWTSKSIDRVIQIKIFLLPGFQLCAEDLSMHKSRQQLTVTF